MKCVLSWWVVVIVKPKSWQWPRLNWRNKIHIYIVAIHDVQMVGDRTGAVMIAMDWDGIWYTIELTLFTWIPSSKHCHPAIDRFIIGQKCCTIGITTTLILKWYVLLPSSSTSILQLLFITANNSMNTMPMPGRRLKPHSTPQYHLARESQHSYPQTIE